MVGTECGAMGAIIIEGGQSVWVWYGVAIRNYKTEGGGGACAYRSLDL